MTKELIDFLIGGIGDCKICPLKTYCDLPSNEEIYNCKAIKKKWLTENFLESDPAQKKSMVNNLIEHLAQEPGDQEIAYSLWYVADIQHEAQEMEIELTPDEVSEILIKLNDIGADVGINWQSIRDTILEVKNKAAKAPQGFIDVIKENKDV
jgi:adenine-specific DNA glycosylase